MRSRTTILLAGLALLAGCAGSDVTAPDELSDGPQKYGTYGVSTDTSTTPTFPASVNIAGHVYAVAQVQPSTPGGDTLSYTPVAGVRIQFYRNHLENGQPTQTLEAEATSDANGAFSVRDVPGGYYVLWPVLSATSPYGDTAGLLYASATDVAFDLYLWKKSQ